jgi:DNA-binding transcriptional MocR family regulator
MRKRWSRATARPEIQLSGLSKLTAADAPARVIGCATFSGPSLRLAIYCCDSEFTG